mmetsp:Transcript_44032/g.137071  ORF Transcript_44032/g.137071 Transcript_44032/m.137071 type:complete len:462 (-) Transcript_44032:132-1517(-)
MVCACSEGQHASKQADQTGRSTRLRAHPARQPPESSTRRTKEGMPAEGEHPQSPPTRPAHRRPPTISKPTYDCGALPTSVPVRRFGLTLRGFAASWAARARMPQGPRRSPPRGSRHDDEAVVRHEPQVLVVVGLDLLPLLVDDLLELVAVSPRRHLPAHEVDAPVESHARVRRLPVIHLVQGVVLGDALRGRVHPPVCQVAVLVHLQHALEVALVRVAEYLDDPEILDARGVADSNVPAVDSVLARRCDARAPDGEAGDVAAGLQEVGRLVVLAPERPGPGALRADQDLLLLEPPRVLEGPQNLGQRVAVHPEDAPELLGDLLEHARHLAAFEESEGRVFGLDVAVGVAGPALEGVMQVLVLQGAPLVDVRLGGHVARAAARALDGKVLPVLRNELRGVVLDAAGPLEVAGKPAVDEQDEDVAHAAALATIAATETVHAGVLLDRVRELLALVLRKVLGGQ